MLFLRRNHPSEFQTILEKFPSISLSEVNVYDSDLISRLIQAITGTGKVIWVRGQPFDAEIPDEPCIGPIEDTGWSGGQQLKAEET